MLWTLQSILVLLSKPGSLKGSSLLDDTISIKILIMFQITVDTMQCPIACVNAAEILWQNVYKIVPLMAGAMRANFQGTGTQN